MNGVKRSNEDDEKQENKRRLKLTGSAISAVQKARFPIAPF
jgi:hypothetical protein